MQNFQQRNFAEIINEAPAFWRDVSQQYFNNALESDIYAQNLPKPSKATQRKANIFEEDLFTSKIDDIQQFLQKNRQKRQRGDKKSDNQEEPSQVTYKVNQTASENLQLSKKQPKIKNDYSQNFGKVTSKILENLNQMIVNQQVSPDSYRYSPLFSFFDYYSDALNDIAHYSDPKDQKETELLQENMIVDPHIQRSEQQPMKILGYEVPVVQVRENYSPDFFLNQQIQNNDSSISIDDQLNWLLKEYEITQGQVLNNIQDLEQKILDTQYEEAIKMAEIDSKNPLLKENFIDVLINLETKQIAESIIRIKAKKPNRKTTYQLPIFFSKARNEKLLEAQQIEVDQNKGCSYEYLVEFDASLNIPNTWVSYKELACLNSLREDIVQLTRQQLDSRVGQDRQICTKNQEITNKKPKKHSNKQGKKAREPQFLGEESQDPGNLGFCHHCKQIKTTYVMSKCNYNSKIHGLFLPVQHVVNGVQLHNVDPAQLQYVNHIIQSKVTQDKKKKKQLEQELDYTCQKEYCSFCLKNCYDTLLQDAQNNKDWICPFCIGQCFCSRCMRQDQLTKIRAYTISLALNEIHKHQRKPSKVLGPVNKSQNFIDMIIKKNFDKIVRASTLAPYADKHIKINFDHKSRPLFMDQFNYQEGQQSHLFKLDQRYAKLITQQQQLIKILNIQNRQLKQAFEEYNRKEEEQMRNMGIECENLINQIQRSYKQGQKQDNDKKKRENKAKTKSTQKNNKTYLWSSFFDEISQKSFNKQSPLRLSSNKSNSTATSQDMANKSAEVDSLIKKRPRQTRECGRRVATKI